MASTSSIPQKTYEKKVHNRAFSKLFNKESADVAFLFCGNGDAEDQNRAVIKAHRNMLSAVSPVFEAMFNGTWKESTAIHIEDASSAAFKAFIEYFYTEKITITTENVTEILYLANKYDIPELVMTCSSFLVEHVTVSDVTECLSVSCTFGLNALKTKCMAIIGENTVEVLASEAFIQCEKDILFEILSIDSCTCHEETFFAACVKWAKSKCAEHKIDAEQTENARSVLGNCFGLIRFKEMRREMLAEQIKHHKDMFTKDEIVEFCTQAKNECSNESRFKYKRDDRRDIGTQTLTEDYTSSPFERAHVSLFFSSPARSYTIDYSSDGSGASDSITESAPDSAPSSASSNDGDSADDNASDDSAAHDDSTNDTLDDIHEYRSSLSSDEASGEDSPDSPDLDGSDISCDDIFDDDHSDYSD